MRKTMSLTLLRWSVFLLVLGIAALGYQYHNLELSILEKQKQLDVLSELQQNSKFADCLKNPRKAKFISKGGEYLPDYENPRSLNEKIVYVFEKYFMRSPITTVIGTKYYAKKYITERAGKQHCVELLGVWDNPEDIEWDKLPSAFVLKTVKGHYGRQVILVRDKSKLDIESTIQKLRDFCDLPYMKQIHKKRIIAEELLTPKNGEPLIDYKIYCAHGRPLVAYCLGMPQDQDDCDVSLKTCSFYSLPDWERLPIVSNNHPAIDVQKPRHLNTMLEVARKLSRDFPLVRIDFYQIGDRVLVGEITEDSNGGVAILEPVEWDFRFGNGLYVPSEKEIEKLIERDTKTYNEYVQNDS